MTSTSILTESVLVLLILTVAWSAFILWTIAEIRRRLEAVERELEILRRHREDYAELANRTSSSSSDPVLP